MANILTHPTNGAIYFDDSAAGSTSIPALTGDAVSLNYDGSAGLNITSYNTTSTDRFSIDGESGRLFSVNDSLTGTIFSVNDAAGLPVIEVESTSSTDTITMGTYASNALVVAGDRVGIGTASPSSSYKLDVNGAVNIAGDIVLGGALDFTGSIPAATSDTDTFLVVDAGELKTRTGAQVLSDIGALSSETITSLALTSGSLVYTNESGTANSISLAAYLDEDSRSIASGSLNSSTGIVTFTRDDSTTFTLDLGPLLDDTNLVTSVAGKSGVVTLVKGDVGLGNVTNESKATMFASPSFTGDVDVAGSITTEGPDGGMVMREWTGGSGYGMIGTANMTGSEYVLLTSGGDTYLSAASGNSVYIRGGANDSTPSIKVTPTNIEFIGISNKASEATALVYDGSNNIGYRELGSAAFSATSAFAAASHTQAFSTITSTPTTVAGYGITDAVSTSALSSYLPLAGGTMTGSLQVSVGGAIGINIKQDTGSPNISGRLFFSNQTAGEGVSIYNGDNKMMFQTGSTFNSSTGSTRMTILASGNVGIGTTSPEVELHVGTATLGVAPDTNADIFSSGGVTLETSKRLSFDADYYIHGNIRYIGSGTAEAKLEYQGYYGHNFIRRSGTSAMVIKGDTGNVGIGTTSPSSKLHVAGQIMISPSSGTPSLKFQDSGTTNAYIDLTDGQQRFDFRNDSTTTMSLKLNNGNVGIGTTNPSYKLDVNGASNSTSLHVNGIDQHSSIRYTLPSQSVSFARTAASNGSDQWFKIYSGGGSTTLIRLSISSGGDNTQSNDEFLISVAGYGFKHHIQRLPAGRYNGSKLLAIATTNPSSGGTVEIWIKLDGMVSGTASTHVFANAGLQSSANILASAAGTAPTITSNGTQLDISATNRNDTTIMASRGATFGGNVGIGTTSPSELLEVSSNTGAADGTTNPTTIRISDTDNGSAWDTTNSFANLDFYSADSSGSGAGTKARVGAIAENSTGAQIGLAFSTTNSADDISEKLRIDASGNVGIGTTSPSANLHVQGSSATDVPIIRVGGFGNSGSTLELAETLSNGNMNYGFSFFNDGNSSNTLQLKRHNNSSAGATIVTFNRTDNNVTFSGDLNVTGSITVGGTVDGRDVAADGTKLDGIADNANNYSHPTHAGDDISIDTGPLTGATVISDLDFNITTNTLGHVTDANGTVSTRTLTAANLGISAPNAPTSLSASIVGETIDLTFNASSTSNIDAYLVYSSVDGGDYGLIQVIPPDDFSATMSVIDTAFSITGTQAYRVYAMKYGILSSAGTASVSYTVSSAEPTDMSVVNLNNAYFVQWNPPSANERFVSAYNVYKHEAAASGSLLRSSASLVYSGLNTNFMYQISGNNNSNYHQFWVETTIA